MKKIFVIAGEASGDSHGARLVAELKKINPSLEFYGLGGEKMLAAGVQVNTDLTRISALGLTDVLLNYFKYREIFYAALERVRQIKPDLIILIDYPGFNLRFAKKIARNIPIIYYISPQIWAWGRRRISVIRKFVDKLIVFFPFEKEMYDQARIPCTYVGHPLTDEIPEMVSITGSVKTLGLLPGSREKEVKRILPVLLEGAYLIYKKFTGINFLLSESSNIRESVYEEILTPFKDKLNIKILRGKPYEVIQDSDLLIVTSGTATLETALHGKPHILVYKAAWLTYFLGRMLIRVSFLGIVNVLSGKRIVPELIQTELTGKNVFKEATSLIESTADREKQICAFRDIRKQLSVGNSAGLSAKEIANFLQTQATASASSKNT